MKIDPRRAVPQAPLALRADVGGGGDEAPEPYDVGQDVTIVSAPDATLVGQTGTIVSQHSGLYYAVDVGGAVSYQPDGNLGGERPVGAEDAAQPPPVDAMPPAAPPPPAAPTARAIAAAGGSSLSAQTEIAQRLAFADRIHALFAGASLDASEGLARAAHQDAREAVALRAAEKVRAAADKVTAAEKAEAQLVSSLRSAVLAGKYDRAELFDVSAEEVMVDGKPVAREKLTPKAWAREMPPAALASMIAAKQARAGGAPRERLEPEIVEREIPDGIATIAAARGYSPAQTQALADLHRKTHPTQETAR